MVADGKSHICALPTHVYAMMSSHGTEMTHSQYASVLGNSEHEIVLMPIHESRHWTLVVIMAYNNSHIIKQREYVFFYFLALVSEYLIINLNFKR